MPGPEIKPWPFLGEVIEGPYHETTNDVIALRVVSSVSIVTVMANIKQINKY